MNTHDIEAFLAVVETGSIMAAATRLNLTQPGVTRRVQNLEEHLGVALFERPGKPLRPTLAGREAYEHGRRVVQAIDDLRSGAAPGGAVRGEMRLGVTPDLSEPLLAAPVDSLRAAFPELMLRLTMSWSAPLLEQLQRNQIDAAALSLPDGAEPPDGLAAEAIDRQAVLVVAEHGADLPERVLLRDLARHPWILSQDSCGYRVTLRRRFEAENLPFTVGIEAPTADLRLSLAARGLGLALVTPGRLDRSPWRDRLRIVAVSDFAPVIRSWLLHRPATGRLHRPLAALRTALRDAVAG